MKTFGVAAPALLVALVAALVLGISGCKLMALSTPPATQRVSVPRAKPSLLEVLTDGGSPSVLAVMRALITATIRGGERILILDDRSGAVLASSTAPAPPSLSVSGRPAPLPAAATSFQKSRYLRAIHQYRARLRNARAAIQLRQKEELMAWARTLVARTDAQLLRHVTGDRGIRAALGAAATDMSSLSQAGVAYGARKVVVILGMDDATASSVPGLSMGLQHSTVVIDDFPGSSDNEAAWQAGLLQAGASRAVLLTPATGDQLAIATRQGLDGAITDTLTSVSFGPGQSALRPAALAQLRTLLRRITVTYPQSTASINGYTDNLPVAGGNLQLSQRRAQAVEAWLVAHGVAASRLQAAGYGDADPLAPNSPSGQPRNRRVVVIIDPTMTA
jgi:outer membrane protein OmpA-like peptidoglycan-associated protein